MADENTERRRTLILLKIVRQWNEKEKVDNGAVCVAICSGCIGSRMAKFLLFFGGKAFTHAQYIIIMYAFLSNLIRYIEFDSAEMRRMNRALNSFVN